MSEKRAKNGGKRAKPTFHKKWWKKLKVENELSAVKLVGKCEIFWRNAMGEKRAKPTFHKNGGKLKVEKNEHSAVIVGKMRNFLGKRDDLRNEIPNQN